MTKNTTEKLKDRAAAQRRAAARALARARWAGTTPEERSAELRWVGSHSPPHGGRKRTKAERCPCDAMTLRCAQARADKLGTGLGHKPGCTFYRAEPHFERKLTAQ